MPSACSGGSVGQARVAGFPLAIGLARGRQAGRQACCPPASKHRLSGPGPHLAEGCVGDGAVGAFQRRQLCCKGGRLQAVAGGGDGGGGGRGVCSGCQLLNVDLPTRKLPLPKNQPLVGSQGVGRRPAPLARAAWHLQPRLTSALTALAPARVVWRRMRADSERGGGRAAPASPSASGEQAPALPSMPIVAGEWGRAPLGHCHQGGVMGAFFHPQLGFCRWRRPSIDAFKSPHHSLPLRQVDRWAAAGRHGQQGWIDSRPACKCPRVSRGRAQRALRTAACSALAGHTCVRAQILLVPLPYLHPSQLLVCHAALRQSF